MSTKHLNARFPDSIASVTAALLVNAIVVIAGVLAVLFIAADLLGQDAAAIGLLAVVLVAAPLATVAAYQFVEE